MNSKRRDPFEAIFGKPAIKASMTVEEHQEEIQLIQEFKNLRIDNYETIQQPQPNQCCINPEVKTILEHSPIPSVVLDNEGNINPELFNATNIDAKEIIEICDNTEEDDLADNKKVTGVFENNEFIDGRYPDLDPRNYVLSSDSSSEPDSNSEFDGAYPSEDSDGFVPSDESNSDPFFSDDD
ncbi:hypothetical protein TRFO_01235 [Tritrichomonas foetus]|uniref:Transcription factor Iwr1 domain-containing protein n=1 Tax=Tritrichomonas foetus TaxID=1144522 RepID=A0A1J4KBS5_9EUKA|nr:hypothetical protein TRFO_01235 [Tritrichomonas foetus]|eukprot:OHT07134.1 hypothetical protein TRFO_01235 [Tritrichomonas foetus]